MGLVTWSDDDIKILKENYSQMPNYMLSNLFPNKTTSAIKTMGNKIGLKKEKRNPISEFWAKNDARLIALYQTHTSDEIADIIGKSVSSVKNRVFKLGLSKPNNRGMFRNGHTPFNKGKKMSAKTYQKCKKTMFSTGSLPHNTKYFGAPYLYTRVRRGITTKLWFIQVDKKRRAYLGYLCEQNNIDLTGKKPRLKPDYDYSKPPTINDILIVTNEENLRLNSIHNYPDELVRLIQVKGALTRQINKRK